MYTRRVLGLVATVLAFLPVNDRTPAVFRCPAPEGETERFKTLIDEEAFDSFCLDPKPGPLAADLLAGGLTTVTPKQIDTDSNMRWRDATVAYARGDLSPKAWLERVKSLGETFHFLTSPKTKPFRDVMADVPVPPGGSYSSRSVFAELFLLSWPGKPCLTSTDIGKTRELPDPGRHQSWLLAMNDWLGPMLSLRHDNPCWVEKQPVIVRADDQPGLLVFKQTDGKQTWTVYLNNSRKSIELPPVDMAKVTINRGIDLDGPKPTLVETGYLIEES